MNKRTRQSKIKTELYVPPHARKKHESETELDTAPKESKKLCEDSSKIFERAAEIEERQKKMYLEDKKNLKLVYGMESDSDDLSDGTLSPELPDTSLPRPETCAVTAKRLVSHALGVKAVFSNSELQDMAKILNARETKKQNSLGEHPDTLEST